jgi:hypothetical protein
MKLTDLGDSTTASKIIAGRKGEHNEFKKLGLKNLIHVKVERSVWPEQQKLG